MVNRYQSMLENIKGGHSLHRDSSILLENEGCYLNNFLKKTESHVINMKTCIQKYREATTMEAEREIMAKYKQEQERLQEARQAMTEQFKTLDQNGKTISKKLQIKERLLMTVQRELKLDVEMNEAISSKENKLEHRMRKFETGSENFMNALADLSEKRDQIIYLQDQVRELMQLLDIVGILSFENTESIECALERVKQANEAVEKSSKVINISKEKKKKFKNTLCFIF